MNFTQSNIHTNKNLLVSMMYTYLYWPNEIIHVFMEVPHQELVLFFERLLIQCCYRSQYSISINSIFSICTITKSQDLQDILLSKYKIKQKNVEWKHSMTLMVHCFRSIHRWCKMIRMTSPIQLLQLPDCYVIFVWKGRMGGSAIENVTHQLPLLKSISIKKLLSDVTISRISVGQMTVKRN